MQWEAQREPSDQTTRPQAGERGQSADILRLKSKQDTESVATAAGSGDRLRLMKAMRRTLSAAMTGECHPRDLSPLTMKLLMVSKEIEALEQRLESEGKTTGGDDKPTFDPASI